MLTTLHRLNAQCLSRLAELAPTAQVAPSLNAVFASPVLWSRMDARCCERAAVCPVLLLDYKFHDPRWWESAAQSSRREEPAGCELTQAPSFGSLLREVLFETWSLARLVPGALCFPFGVAPEVCAVISCLTAADLEHILAEHGGAASPRWPRNRKFWDLLLTAAVTGNDEALQRARLYALQLLGRDFLSPPH
jgi:hypothetical protein